MIHITAERFIPEIDKLTVKQLRQNMGISRRQLAEMTEVSLTTLSNMENPNYQYCIRFDAALLVAKALGEEYHRIRWIHPHSDHGRSIGSGRPLRSVRRKLDVACKTCNLTLPATGICDDCS